MAEREARIKSRAVRGESWVQTGLPEFAAAERLYGGARSTELSGQKLTEEQKKVKELFRQSFRFSQGDPDLHNKVSSWLVATGHYDNLPIPAVTPEYIDALRPPIRHASMDADIIDVDIRMAWGHLYWINTVDRPDSADAIAGDILTHMVERDLQYVNEGRPGRKFSTNGQETGTRDPFASYIKEFVVEGTPTGTEAFDQMHAGVKDVLTKEQQAIQSGEDLTERQQKLQELQTVWEQKHEGQTFLPDNKDWDTTPTAKELQEGEDQSLDEPELTVNATIRAREGEATTVVSFGRREKTK